LEVCTFHPKFAQRKRDNKTNQMARPIPTIYLREDVHFNIWVLNFRGQLRKLHEELVVENEDGSQEGFQGMTFEDFCLLTYTDHPDLIDELQN